MCICVWPSWPQLWTVGPFPLLGGLSLLFCFPSSLLGPSLLGWPLTIDHIYKCL